MPRIDARAKTKIPVELFSHNEDANYEKNTMISELSLSGALIDSRYHEINDIITIKPELSECNKVNLVGEVVRKDDGKTAVAFRFTDKHTKANLWEHIKEHLSEKSECHYCNRENNPEVEYCESCDWLLNFNDKDYLSKHDRESFTKRIQNSSAGFDLDQRQRVLDFVDAELLNEKNVLHHKEFTDVVKSMREAFEQKRNLNAKDVSCLDYPEEGPEKIFLFESLLSQHPAMVRVVELIMQIADSDANILIQGESGTGKELIAHALHNNNSRRKNNPFIPVNCGAIPDNLMESELFGYTRGAFTGAVSDKAGLFEAADGGTIFLDEVSEMTPAMQVKLLRILQTGEYSRLGSAKIHNCDARILAATNKDLQKLVQRGLFREDLYYRLNVLDIVLPPLRERKCDVPLLSQHFLKTFCLMYGKKDLRLDRDAGILLMSYDFPGNVRELENIIQRAVVLSNGETIGVQQLPEDLCGNLAAMTNKGKASTFKISKQNMIEQFERKYIIDCLRTTIGNISHGARNAGIDVKNFYKKMKKYGIEPQSFKKINSITETEPKSSNYRVK